MVIMQTSSLVKWLVRLIGDPEPKASTMIGKYPEYMIKIT